jgi:hypothetical protein
LEHVEIRRFTHGAQGELRPRELGDEAPVRLEPDFERNRSQVPVG